MRLTERVRGIRHPFVIVSSGAALIVLLSACDGPSPTPSPSAMPAIDALCADPLVIECGFGDPVSSVTVDGDVMIDELSGLLSKVEDVASEPAYAGTLTLRGRATDPQAIDPDVTVPSQWQLGVPVGGLDEFEATLSEILTAAAVPGAMGVTETDGWPSVLIETIDQFPGAFDALSATPLFEDGGTYLLQAPAEHLRIVHVPSRTSDEAIAEVIAIARDYPEAEVLLEATTYEPQVPTFYVSSLTPEQVAEIDARLRDPRLADADVDGWPLDYVLGSLGNDGVTYVNGTFGGVEAG